MNISIYIWKENQQPLSSIEKKQELINGLLKDYFNRPMGPSKHSTFKKLQGDLDARNEPTYSPPEASV